MALANVISLQSGTNFIINVAAAQLSSDVTEKDFTVLHNGIAVSNLNYNKTTQNTLTYVGASLPSTTVEIRRKTSFDQSSNLVTYANRFQTNKWNDALLRIQRWEEEVDLNGAGSVGAGVIPIPANDPYGSVWINDTVYPPTRKVVYDKVETLATKASPALSGVPTAPTASVSNNSTQLATTAHVKNVLGNAPAITNPSVSEGTFTSPTIFTPDISGGSVTGVLIVPSSSPNVNFLTSAQALSHQDASAVINNRFLVSATRGAAQTANNGTTTVATFVSAARNIGNCFDVATGIFTAPYTGWYSISCYLSVTASGGTLPTALRFLLDIATARAFDVQMPATSIGQSGQVTLQMTAGSTTSLNAVVIPTGGSGFSLLLAGSGINRLTITYLSP